MVKRYPLLVLLVVLRLVGCIALPPPRTCDEIALLQARRLMQQAMPSEQMVAQIAGAFQLPAEAVAARSIEATATAAPWLSDDNRVGDVEVSWRRDGMQYSRTWRDQHIIYLGVRHESRPPSVEHVTQCLGEPGVYWAGRFALDTARYLDSLQLLYPDLGIAATANKHGQAANSGRFDGSTPVQQFSLALPSPPDDIIARLLNPTESALVHQIEEQLRPWPDRWEDIIVETSSPQ